MEALDGHLPPTATVLILALLSHPPYVIEDGEMDLLRHSRSTLCPKRCNATALVGKRLPKSLPCIYHDDINKLLDVFGEEYSAGVECVLTKQGVRDRGVTHVRLSQG
jgi:hypothetical protein